MSRMTMTGTGRSLAMSAALHVVPTLGLRPVGPSGGSNGGCLGRGSGLAPPRRRRRSTLP